MANPYRFGTSFIARWENLLTKVILIGFGGGAVLVVVGLGLGATLDGRVPEDDPLWWTVWGLLGVGALLVALAVLVPLLIGCVLGGLAIHRHGWVPGLLTYVGILATAVGAGLGDEYLGDWLDGWLTTAGLVTLVAGVLGFFLVGHLAKVPMSIGGVPVGSGRGSKVARRSAGRRRNRR